MNFLLDTNACIGIMGRTNSRLISSYNEHLWEGESFYLSSISIFELSYGIEKSAHPFHGRSQLDDLLVSVAILPFEDQDAQAAARIRAQLELAKQPIGPYDTLIAGQAVARDLTLITANVREFSRVPQLQWQDWTLR